MILTKVRALLAGEVAADTLEAYRHAGLGVYALLDKVESQRVSRKIEGTDPWSAPRVDQLEALYAWNAFLLQTIGDAFLDEDYRFDPGTVGYVPAVTADQALACYVEVEVWLGRAARVRANPEAELGVELPAELSPWRRAEPCPVAHIEALLAAMRAARSHANAALAVFEREGLPVDRQAVAQRLRALAAEATATADYAGQLWDGKPPQSLHRRIEQDARTAIERFYLVGQLLAVPDLLDRYDKRRQTPAPSPAPNGALTTPTGGLPAPGEPGFDPWCLTDPGSREQWQRDPDARASIDYLWVSDPDPRRTLAIQAEIGAALASGDIAYATTGGGQRLGSYYRCPFSAIYVAERPTTIGEQRLGPRQEFTYDVCAADPANGIPFVRRILLGSFRDTDEVMYHKPGGVERDRRRGGC